MSNYLIGIGGTGAKCVEAAVHLAAAGLLSPRDSLYILFIDPDKSNGTLSRAQVTLRKYLQCQEIEAGADACFRTKLSIANPEVWSTFDEDGKVSLSQALGYNQLHAHHPELRSLFDVLYSPEERSSDLSVGFRGHPSIGAAIFAKTVAFDEVEPWITFRQRIENDKSGAKDVRIFLCGSLFGGTGASGLPTVARLLKKEVADTSNSKARLGCALVQPYFSFDFSGGAADSGLKADSSSFIPNTQSALRYYWTNNFTDIYDRIYTFGDELLSPVSKASIGGSNQRNDPHFIELYGGLAILDFFSSDVEDEKGIILTARKKAGALTWDDLPHRDRQKLTERLVHFAHFAFAYLAVYEPALQKASSDIAYALPWYVDFFERRQMNPHDAVIRGQREAIKEYCIAFLSWIAELHVTSPDGSVQLINWRAFAQRKDEKTTLRKAFDLDQFGGLEQGKEGSPGKLDRLWRYMCSRPKTGDTQGFGSFIRALYDGCSASILKL